MSTGKSKTLLRYEEAKKRRGENLVPALTDEDETILDRVWANVRQSQSDDAAANIHLELTQAGPRVFKQ